MPIFDFKCTKCDKIDERLIRRDDIDTQLCKDCQALMVKTDDIHPMQFALRGVWFKSHKRY